MNQQNMMQQYYEQQQGNVNGFPNAGFPANQQMSVSFGNGSASSTIPFIANSSLRSQNGLQTGFGMNDNNDNFDMQSMNTQSQTGFLNFMDPRMAGFDLRNRPNFDPNGMMPSMENFNSNSGFPGKMRVNEMAAMFNNPVALAAFQRQRMNSMFGQGRENDFMSPTNPFAGFPQQAAQFMQQQRIAAFQRQVQEQMVAQSVNNRTNDHSRNPSGVPSTVTSSIRSTNSPNFNQNSQNPQSNFPVPNYALHNRQNSVAGSEASQDKLSQPQTSQSTGPTVNSTTNQSSTAPTKFSSDGGRSTPNRSPLEGGNDPQRNAAMVAAAAVRAAAAASHRFAARANFQGNAGGSMGSYPFAPRGYHMNNEQMPSPFPIQNMQSPDFNVMSPNKDMSSLTGMNAAASPMSNQGCATPRSGNPPPYSPMPHSTDSNHSASGSMKGSIPNLASISRTIDGNQQNSQQHQHTNSHQGTEESNDQSNFNQAGHETVSENNHDRNSSVMIAGNPTKLSAPLTPLSLSAASPAPSFQDEAFDNMSPSWPQTPLSPNAQKILKARSSPKQYEQLSKVYDLIDDVQKKNFLERYLAFMSVNGTPVTKLPVIGKKPLDLYTLFRAVCERGGIQEVMEKRRFREVLNCLQLPSGNSTIAYLVKSQYHKYLSVYETKSKDAWLKQWKNSSPLTSQPPAAASDVPTIALNDSLQTTQMGEAKPVMNRTHMNDTFQMDSGSSASNWIQNSFSNTMTNSSVANSTIPGNSNQYGPRMSFGTPSSNNQGMSPYGQQGIPGYTGQQEIPAGYSAYGGYQNPMFPRGALPNYNAIRPGMPTESMGGSWPRGFSPRQGPPELFPEGLQRMPFSHTQRHPLSAFGTPTYPGKPRGQMPPISRDQQMKYNAHQQQLKLQHQYHQQRSFNVPDPTVKPGSKGNHRTHGTDNKANTSTPTHPMKRESNFPPDCAESTKPVLKKRKKLTSKDLGPVEAWRIMMSLKSGLLAECTWAIDTLNILLADNNTITYFHLSQLPGLLDALMDHYRRSLTDLFGAFKDLEIPLLPEQDKDQPCEVTNQSVQRTLSDLWVGVCRNAKSSHSSNIAAVAVTSNINESLPCGKEFWERGGGDSTSHIRTTFPCKDVKLKAFPKGLSYVTKADEEKHRKLQAMRQTVSRLHSSDDSSQSLDCPSNSTNSSNDNNEQMTTETSTKTELACMGVLLDLIKDYETEQSTEKKEAPLVEKLLKDLEFNIVYDKKYLEDSKEFIEYLNRRLQKENRGNVQSEQCVVKQNTPFVGIPDSEKSLLHRCVALSNIFRSLSFIQGNDAELAGHVGLLLVCGHILLHKHEHAMTDHSQFKLGLEERVIVNNAIAEEVSGAWWDSLFAIRENTLVMLANIGGHLNLTRVNEHIHRALIDGLLHWLVCRSSEAVDPLPTAPGNHALSAQRLAMETLAKMTINSSNVGIVVDCSSQTCLDDISDVLVKQIARKHPVPTREFAIILLDNLANSEQFSKMLALRRSAISNLVKFIYEAEKNTSMYLSCGGRVQPGLNAEDICGTSISLLRRSVNILLSVAKVPCNRNKLTPYTDDILALSTSQMIDTSVLALLAQVLFELSL